MHLDGALGSGSGDAFAHLGTPDDIDVSIELRDWLFALEGREGVAERWESIEDEDIGREERCWHTNFRSFRVVAKSTPKLVDPNETETKNGARKFPVDSIIVSICTPYFLHSLFPFLNFLRLMITFRAAFIFLVSDKITFFCAVMTVNIEVTEPYIFYL